MKYIRKISLPALLRYNFGDQSEAVRQDVKARGRCDVRYIRSTTRDVYAHLITGCVYVVFRFANKERTYKNRIHFCERCCGIYCIQLNEKHRANLLVLFLCPNPRGNRMACAIKRLQISFSYDRICLLIETINNNL